MKMSWRYPPYWGDIINYTKSYEHISSPDELFPVEISGFWHLICETIMDKIGRKEWL